MRRRSLIRAAVVVVVGDGDGDGGVGWERIVEILDCIWLGWVFYGLIVFFGVEGGWGGGGGRGWSGMGRGLL